MNKENKEFIIWFANKIPVIIACVMLAIAGIIGFVVIFTFSIFILEKTVALIGQILAIPNLVLGLL